MAISSAAPSFYVTGGTLPPDASSYVERAADRELLSALLDGEYCYVLNSRQMGKSSLCVRTMARLREEGVHTAFLDLTKYGGRNLTAEQWYAALLADAGRELGLRREFLDWWRAGAEEGLGPMQRFFSALQEVALTKLDGPIVVLIDEIDVTLSLPFSADELFTAVRQCYVGRANNPQLKRLSFCLLGTASPTDLVQDTRVSPFNIGRRIELRDFTREEAAPLAAGVGRGRQGEAILSRVLYWTGGHPFLTQRLCRCCVECGAVNEQGVDRACNELFLTHTAKESDDNLAFVRNRLLRSEADLASLLDTYRKMRSGRPVPDDETNVLTSILKLSGVAAVESGLLRVRNRIYEHVFDRQWVEQHMPHAELIRQRRAYRRGMVRMGSISLAIVAVIAALAASSYRNAKEARHSAELAKRSAKAATEHEKHARAEADRANQLAYAANMNLAEQALEEGDFDRVQTRLDETEANIDRGFEWNYLYRAIHGERWLKRPSNILANVQFLPDDKSVFVAGMSMSQRPAYCAALSAGTGEELFRPTGVIRSAVVSPGGRWLLVGDSYQKVGNTQEPGTFAVWDLQSRAKVAEIPGKHGFAQLSDDASLVLTTEKEGFSGRFTSPVRVYDWRARRLVATLPEEWCDASFNRGSDLIIAWRKGMIATFGARTGRLIASAAVVGLPNLWGGYSHREAVSTGIQLPGESTAKGDLVLRDLLTWHVSRRIRTGLPSIDLSVLLAHSDRVLLQAEGDPWKVQMWDLRSKRKIWSVEYPKSKVGLFYPILSDNEKWLGLLPVNGGLSLRDTETGHEARFIAGATGTAAIGADGQSVLTCDTQGRVRLYDERKPANELHLGEVPERGPVYFALDGRLVHPVRVGGKWCTQLRRLDGDRAIVALPFSGLLAFSSDGRRAIGAVDRPGTAGNPVETTLSVYDTLRGSFVCSLGRFHGGTVQGFTRDGAAVIVGQADGSIRALDSSTGRLIRSYGPLALPVMGVLLLEDGSHFMAWGFQRHPGSDLGPIWHEVRTFEISTGKEVWHSRQQLLSAFGLAGRHLVTKARIAKPVDPFTSLTSVVDPINGTVRMSITAADVSFASDGSYALAVFPQDVEVPRPPIVLDCRTGATIVEMSQLTNLDSGVHFAAGGRLIMIRNHRLSIWSLRSGRELMSVPWATDFTSQYFFVSQDGTRFGRMDRLRNGQADVTILDGRPVVGGR